MIIMASTLECIYTSVPFRAKPNPQTFNVVEGVCESWRFAFCIGEQHGDAVFYEACTKKFEFTIYENIFVT